MEIVNSRSLAALRMTAKAGREPCGLVARRVLWMKICAARKRRPPFLVVKSRRTPKRRDVGGGAFGAGFGRANPFILSIRVHRRPLFCTGWTWFLIPANVD